VVTARLQRTISRARRAVLRAAGSRSLPLRRLAGPAVLVAVLALLVRLLYLADAAPGLHTPAQPGVRMAARYSDAAAALLEGDGILYPRTWPDRSDTALVSRPPGYPAFVALVQAVAGRTYLAVLSAQALVTVLLPVLLLWLASRAVGHRAGLAAGLVAAASPPLGYYAAVFTPDALAALLAVATVVVLWCGRRRPAAAAIVAGTLVGVATWLRPNFLLLPLLLLVALWLAVPRRGGAWRAALVVVTAWAIVAPITIRNYRLYGELVPVSSNFGIVLWEGIADLGGERFGAHPADREVARDEAVRLGDRRYAQWWASPDGIRRDRDRVRRSLEVIGAHPWWFVAGCLRRAASVIGQQRAAPLVSASLPPPPDPEGESRWLALAGAAGWLRPPVRWLQQISTVPGAWLRACGLALMVLLAPRRALLLLAVPLYVLAMQSPVHFEPRFALPLHAFSPVLEGLAWAVLPCAVVAGVAAALSESGR